MGRASSGKVASRIADRDRDRRISARHGDLAETSNLLAVAIDRRFDGQADRVPVSVKVIGVEDLITEQITVSRTEGAPSREAVTRVRALTALARAGVGG